MNTGQQAVVIPETMLTPTATADVPRWFAIQTRGRHEKKVAAQLMEKRIETFLPTVKELHRWSDRKKIVEIPLFPSYTFVRISATSDERLAVLQTEGVVKIVSAGMELIPIDPREIEDIRTLIGSGVQLMMYPFLKVGQRIRVRGGCLNGLEGILVARPREYTLVVSIDAIQRSIAVNIDSYQIEPV